MTWTGPRLEDMLDDLAITSADILGDGLSYTPAGGIATPMRGYVDFGDQQQDMQTGKVIAQDIRIELPIATCPIRPTGQARLTINLLPGIVFKPIDIERSDDGHHWVFNVEKVVG
ncbi:MULTISPECIES: hypothetical protein [unclassified Novosphingobium]|uniref:hypothetical protein n=1 Tax=unclassified Novosphingobium TaxID=2644732 RepID=UPI000D3F8FF7|nr:MULTISPECIES: hypothetical protein [unclassified Novosphingobium]PTR08680.1 hypothetical protein C8K11_111126 [Novosphingobium sp. GV055]PUB01403.1 hypothetical protein C8K12_111126 [Novosphingobium sp. GV061]PUB16977.1 hypothetical protein C8K14_111126 [Novosphingobium sp. GV079]PUB40000.1 hypothetical protein C8K10_111126 [Novosphingobium sp. GV027]